MKTRFRFTGKAILPLALLFFIVLFVSARAFAWQGRMAGAGDVYGLYEDESDYLIHPAAITSSGNDINVYGTYRLTYDKTPKWNNTTTIPSEYKDYPFEATGFEWRNEVTAGMAFPLGAGRMGVFFEYIGKIAEYEGDETDFGSGTNDHEFTLKSNLNYFNLRAIYGNTIGGVKLGGEIQISYKNEENLDRFDDFEGKNIFTIIAGSPAFDLYTYLIPYRSNYLELLGKISVEGKIGNLNNTLTLKGGAPLPFVSNNKYAYRNGTDETDMTGEVNGWNVGIDYWGRFVINNDLSIPFLVGIGHKWYKKDGSGDIDYTTRVSYEHQTEYNYVTAGGGIDLHATKSTNIAAGLYYDFNQSNQNVDIKDDLAANDLLFVYPNYPKKQEHRVTLKAMMETKLSPDFSILSGLNAFYGFVKNDYLSSFSNSTARLIDCDLSANGYNWGINISLGASFKTGNVTIEPFINAGYYQLNIDGDGNYNSYFTTEYFICTGELERTDWMIGGGLSVKY